MKKIRNYIIAAVLTFGGISCGDDYVDILPKDRTVLDDYFKNEIQIQSVTGTLYSRPWFGFNDKFSWAAGDGMAGDLYNDYQDEGQLFFFTYSATNSIVYNAWKSLYDVIAISNTIINDMPRIASKNGAPEDAISRGLGEARFMRAAAYFFLTEFWGDVPIVENPVEMISSNKMDVPRNTQASVYEFIRRDLVFAAENLPTSSSPGRVTSWSAKGMLAKLHVTLGHFTKSQDHFNQAKQYAVDVIENSGLALMANYGDLFRIANNNNPESLFALQWSNNNWGVGNSRQAVMARNSIVTGNDECWGGGKSATYSFMENVVNNARDAQGNALKDPRLREIIMTLGETYPEMHGYTYNIVTPNPDGGGDLEFKAPLLNNVKKYVVGTQADAGVPIKNQGVPINQYMLRLADVYLLYAEAEIGNNASTTDPTALQYFNAVRTRGNGAFGKLPPRTGALTFEQVMNERRVEFGIEGIAWYDIKRRYYRSETEAINYLNSQNRAITLQQIDGWQGDRNVWDAYEIELPATPVTVTPSSFKLPVPADEVSLTPTLADEPVDYTFE